MLLKYPFQLAFEIKYWISLYLCVRSGCVRGKFVHTILALLERDLHLDLHLYNIGNPHVMNINIPPPPEN